MDKPVIICGGPDTDARTRAYLQLVGRHRVSVAPRIGEFSNAVVDVRGGMAAKRLLPYWQEHGCTVISDGPLAPTLAASQQLLDQGSLLLILPSLYDPRHQLILGQAAGGAIGDLVSVRLIRLLPMQTPLWDSITLSSGLDPLALVQALGGPVARVMLREQALRRRRPDSLFATGRFRGGGLFYLELSMVYPHDYHSERIEVVGTEGMLEYESDSDRGLRLTTAAGRRSINALHEPALVRMLRDYLRRMDDASAMEDHRERLQAALQLLFRGLDSAQTNQAR